MTWAVSMRWFLGTSISHILADGQQKKANLDLCVTHLYDSLKSVVFHVYKAVLACQT